MVHHYFFVESIPVGCCNRICDLFGRKIHLLDLPLCILDLPLLARRPSPHKENSLKVRFVNYDMFRLETIMEAEHVPGEDKFQY